MTASATIHAPTFVIGPEQQGRGYAIQAASSPGLGRGWSSDLSMAILAWGASLGLPDDRMRQDRFVACIPVRDGGLVVCMAQYFGQLELGPDARVWGCQLSAADFAEIEGATHEVARLLLERVTAEPTPKAFAAEPLEIRWTAAPPAPWIDAAQRAAGAPDLHLAWGDRLIRMDNADAAWPAVYAALASIDPPEQRLRIRGWITTTELPPRGGIEPLRQSQLVVAGADAPDLPGLVPYAITADGQMRGTAITIPSETAYAAWQALVAAMATIPDAPPLPVWDSAMAQQPQRQIALELTRGVAVELGRQSGFDHGVVIAFLAALMRAPSPLPAVVRQGALDFAAEYLAVLRGNRLAQQAVPLFAEVSRELGDSPPALLDYYAFPALFAEMSAAQLGEYTHRKLRTTLRSDWRSRQAERGSPERLVHNHLALLMACDRQAGVEDDRMKELPG